MSVDHEWATDPDIVVRTQMAISVYLNQFGELVIRQEGYLHRDEDVWVVITPGNVPRLVAAMENAIGATTAATTSKDMTAAQRQRRRRNRQRDNKGLASSVTADGTVTVSGSHRDSGETRGVHVLLAAA